jgi:hypothetical protein
MLSVKINGGVNEETDSNGIDPGGVGRDRHGDVVPRPLGDDEQAVPVLRLGELRVQPDGDELQLDFGKVRNARFSPWVSAT